MPVHFDGLPGRRPRGATQGAGDDGKRDGKADRHPHPRIIAPDGGDAWPPAKPRPDETLIRALARAHRWKWLLLNRT